MNRHQRGHVDMTDLHRLMVVLALITLVILVVLLYGGIRLTRWAWSRWGARCEHEAGPWQMRNMGLGKVRYCTKCDKCMDVV